MRTENEIRDKLERMRRGLSNFSDPTQIKQQEFGIRLLNYVLGEAPEEIMVPKPASRVTKEDK